MKRYNGFTLIELVITIAILGVLTAVSYPSYKDYILKTKRAQALTTLHDIRMNYENYFIEKHAYPANNELLPEDTSSDPQTFYRYSSVVTGSTYTLTATALKSQVADAETDNSIDPPGKISCSVLDLDNEGVGSPGACWGTD